MKRQIVASVLLASMTFALPVYAAGNLTPDEYNPEEKYESPLDQDPVRIVNDYRNPENGEEDEFAQVAGQFMQGAASGKKNSANPSNNAVLSAASVQNDPAADKAKAEDKNKSDLSNTELEKKIALEKIEKRAEKILLETDEGFEPSLEKEFPGSEYVARLQAGSQPDDFTAQAESKGSGEGIMKQGSSSIQGGLRKNELKPMAGSKNNQVLSNRKSVLEQEKKIPVVTGNKTAKKNNTKEKGKDEEKAENIPVVITGEKAQYANDSGDFIIEGNVNVKQGVTHLTSTKAVGNAKTGDIWLLEGGTMAEPTNKVKAHWAHYNFNQETGELLHLKGASSTSPGSKKHDYYEAPHGIIENGMLIFDQGGTTTRCPAIKHSNCLSVKAKTITIIPNDRIIARGVQVFVKGKHIYSRDVWINDLQKKRNEIKPTIGWDDDKGWYVSLAYSRPIGNPLLKNPTTVYMHQVYYTKSKYKPFYGIRHDEHDFYVRLNHGYVYDTDNDDIDGGIWLQKKMDWGFFLKPHRFAKGIPLSYEASLTHGLWKYTHRDWDSWHTEGKVLIRHDRIYPLGGKKLSLDLMVGRKWVHESLDNRTTQRYGKSLKSDIYHGTLGYKFSNKWNIWTTFHHEHKTGYLFSLGQPSFTRDLNYGLAWSPDKHNTFRIVNRHNLDSGAKTHGLYTTTYSWVHRFCCEALTVSYQKKHYNHKNEWTVMFDFLNW